MAENACSLPATHYSLLHSEFLVRDRAFRRTADELGVFREHASGFGGWTNFVRAHAGSVLGVWQENVDGVFHGIDFDEVARAHDADRTATSGFGSDVTHVETMTAAGETSVGDECNNLDQTATGDGAGR